MNAGGLLGAGAEAGPERSPPTPNLSPAVLAYIGDAVFGLLVRKLVLERLCPTADAAPPSLAVLHRAVEPLVAAEGQARMLLALWPALRPEEQDVVRRARNAKVRHRPKGVDYITYRRSTGLEALAGYLYLRGQTDRLVELLKLGLELNDGDAAGSHATT